MGWKGKECALEYARANISKAEITHDSLLVGRAGQWHDSEACLLL